MEQLKTFTTDELSKLTKNPDCAQNAAGATILILKTMQQNNLWKEIIGVALLVFFAGYGIAHVIYPDRFLKPWHRGGEMLTGRNRTGIQIVGAIFAGFAIYVLYSIFRG